jgi:hypothetical protein
VFGTAPTPYLSHFHLDPTRQEGVDGLYRQNKSSILPAQILKIYITIGLEALN